MITSVIGPNIKYDTYVNVSCDEKNENCYNTFYMKYGDAIKNINRNFKIVCDECMHRRDLSENNMINDSNHIDKKYFNEINNIEKAYLYGLIIFNLDKINKKDNILSISLDISKSYENYIKISNIIFIIKYVSSIIYFNTNNITFDIKNKNIIKDICNLCNIKNINDIYNIKYKYIFDNSFKENNDYKLAFIRAYYEKYVSFEINNIEDRCYILFQNEENLKEIVKFLDIPNKYEVLFDNLFKISYKSVNMIDLMGKIYSNSEGLKYQLDKYNKYINIIKNNKFEIPKIKIYKSIDNAVIPTKNRESDAGYDLTIIKETKKYNEITTLYDTGIKLDIPNGYYVEIVPRSSLSKSGYMLANSIGIIDQSYRGNLFIALTKINKNSSDIELPFRCCQMIVRKQEYSILEEYNDNFEETNRNEGGFGSTN